MPPEVNLTKNKDPNAVCRQSICYSTMCNVQLRSINLTGFVIVIAFHSDRSYGGYHSLPRSIEYTSHHEDSTASSVRRSNRTWEFFHQRKNANAVSLPANTPSRSLESGRQNKIRNSLHGSNSLPKTYDCHYKKHRTPSRRTLPKRSGNDRNDDAR